MPQARAWRCAKPFSVCSGNLLTLTYCALVLPEVSLLVTPESHAVVHDDRGVYESNLVVEAAFYIYIFD